MNSIRCNAYLGVEQGDYVKRIGSNQTGSADREDIGVSKLRDIIARRMTEKVLADPLAPLPINERPRTAVDSLLATAGNAPFHYQTAKQHREKLSSAVPWRMYKLDAVSCRTLLDRLINRPEVSIIRDMLAAADYVILTTWTPDPDDDTSASNTDAQPFVGSLRNMEHIAAGGAAIQNVLLLATEAGWSTYWSSGGILKSAEIFELLEIPTSEILLGAVFLFPSDRANTETRPGKLREARGGVSDWSRWVAVPNE